MQQGGKTMRTLTSILAVAAAFALLNANPAFAQHEHGSSGSEADAVRASVQHYLQGHATGDGAHFEMVFHPESKLFWMRDGQLNQRTSADYIAGAGGEPAADEVQRKRRIAMVDVTGSAAVAKVELDYPGAMITDYFTLLKVDGEWKIVNKIFHVEPRGE